MRTMFVLLIALCTVFSRVINIKTHAIKACRTSALRKKPHSSFLGLPPPAPPVNKCCISLFLLRRASRSLRSRPSAPPAPLSHPHPPLLALLHLQGRSCGESPWGFALCISIPFLSASVSGEVRAACSLALRLLFHFIRLFWNQILTWWKETRLRTLRTVESELEHILGDTLVSDEWKEIPLEFIFRSIKHYLPTSPLCPYMWWMKYWFSNALIREMSELEVVHCNKTIIWWTPVYFRRETISLRLGANRSCLSWTAKARCVFKNKTNITGLMETRFFLFLHFPKFSG